MVGQKEKMEVGELKDMIIEMIHSKEILENEKMDERPTKPTELEENP